MKRNITILLAVMCLFLCGCGENEAAAFESFRSELQNADAISFTADVRAEYEDKTAEFELAFAMADDEYTVEILEPSSVAGMKAHVKSGETHLDYDGAILDIGRLTDRGLCPMSALPYLMDAIKDAYADLAWTEDGLLTVSLVPSDDMRITLWIDENEPQNAEITYNEKTVVFIEIDDWEISENEGPAEENVG